MIDGYVQRNIRELPWIEKFSRDEIIEEINIDKPTIKKITLFGVGGASFIYYSERRINWHRDEPYTHIESAAGYAPTQEIFDRAVELLNERKI